MEQQNEPNILNPIIRAAKAVAYGEIDTIDPRVRHLPPDEIRALQQICIDVSIVLGGLQARIESEDHAEDAVFMVCYPGETDFHLVPWYVLDESLIDAAWERYRDIFRPEHPGNDIHWGEFPVPNKPEAIGLQASSDDVEFSVRRVAGDPQATPIPAKPLLKSLVLAQFAVVANGGVSPYADAA